MRAISTVLMLVAVSGCAGGSSVSEPPASAQEMNAIILTQRSNYWKDPESIRDAKVGAPFSCLGWSACVCIAANAKNGFGGYTGLKGNVAMFSGRTLISIREAGFTDQCDNMAPWPEFNGGYVAPAAPKAPAPSRK